MADRTYYFQLAFQAGYLQDVEEAAQDSFGLVDDDLDDAEKEAIDRILRLLTGEVGWATAKEWGDDWVDETTTYPDHVPRCIRTLAEYIGSAMVWRRLENFNREVAEEGNLLLSERLMKDAEKLWDSILKAGVIVYEDGTDAIDLTSASGNTGVGVSGAAYLFCADYEGESVDGVRPKYSTEGLYKELNG